MKAGKPHEALSALEGVADAELSTLRVKAAALSAVGDAAAAVATLRTGLAQAAASAGSGEMVEASVELIQVRAK
jgi:hypothetical protein